MVRKTLKNRLPPRAATFSGVSYWYKDVMERLGWTIIAKAKGYNDKVVAYKNSIRRLLATIDSITEEYENHNRKHDLNVMRMNVNELQRFVTKNL